MCKFNVSVGFDVMKGKNIKYLVNQKLAGDL